MKITIALTVIATLAAKISAENCFAEIYGYGCCSDKNTEVVDVEGDWGMENGKWCGIQQCAAQSYGYNCCPPGTKAIYTDEIGGWGAVDGNWCGIDLEEPTVEDPKVEEPKIEEPKDENQYTINGNPFEGVKFFLNPYYRFKVEDAIANMTDETLIAKAEKMKEYSNAVWLDSIEITNGKLDVILASALREQKKSDKPVLTVFVLNDIPGRGCHSIETNAELNPNDDDFNRYKTEYIDVIAETLDKYRSQPVVLIVEPDSLVNMIVNGKTTPACKDAEKYIREGHAYLIQKLGSFPHVALYLDMGNTYWIGWDDIRGEAAETLVDIVKSGAPGVVRGFSSNVGKYNPWMDTDDTGSMDYDPGFPQDERRFLEAMRRDLIAAGMEPEKIHFISDTSRNGQKTKNYDTSVCNEFTVSAGMRPQANPIPEMSFIDAFYWVKNLGESDGSLMNAEGNCIPNSPYVDEWSQRQFELGITNANPSL
ncbi:glycoside hydrolase family 6 protein [Piromyces sp. E2]|nr:glycoside hydrolase family 6 protein [Piromyces sp. E2]|eukprot:OUM57803.1 glycoside hydrolase family 6 protein [Piromyces sp. E2]